MDEDRLRDSPKIEKCTESESPTITKSATLKPIDFPVTVPQCPPGPFVYHETLYFKTASGEIYMDNGRALPGEFADLLVSPVCVEWDELVDGDMEDPVIPWTVEMSIEEFTEKNRINDPFKKWAKKDIAKKLDEQNDE
jgi:hypothetical protein